MIGVKLTVLTAPLVIGMVMAQSEASAVASGWASFGIAGLVLSWLLLIHLPAKDKQTLALAAEVSSARRESEERYETERVAERLARHERANNFQAMLNQISLSHERSIKELNEQHSREAKEMNDQHVRDAAADREAFIARQDDIKNAIVQSLAAQGTSLELAIIRAVQGICRFSGECDNYKPRSKN